MRKPEIRMSRFKFKHGCNFKPKPAWIVIHYSGVANASASNVEKSMANSERVCSTHFICDEKEIVSCVPENTVAWHVGNGQCKQPYKDKTLSLEQLSQFKANDWRYDLAANNHIQWLKSKHDFKGNSQSLGIDLCVRKQSTKSKKATDQDWYIEHETATNAAKLVAYLCEKYNIPTNRIIRHADATGKPCPRPFVSLPNDDQNNLDFYDNMWMLFKDKVEHLMNEQSERDDLDGLARYEQY